MTSPGDPAVRDALERARAAASRLAATPDDTTALTALEGARLAAESVLKARLGEPALDGRALIREARARELLTLEQAHALIALDSIAVTSGLPDAGRDALRQLASALDALPAAGPVSEPVRLPPPTAPPPEIAHTAVAASARRLWWLVAAALALAGSAFAFWYFAFHAGYPGHLRRGLDAYRRGDQQMAAVEFRAAAARRTGAAMPHILLARIARDAGNPQDAVAELTTAIQLEPENALALREMAAHALAAGDLDMARRFYVRALQRDPTDRPAMGYLACVLKRQGRTEEADRFLARAGSGEWSGCTQ